MANAQFCFTIKEDKRGGDADMKMRYVSNAGMVFETNKISIGIDCFCKDETGVYQDLEASVKEDLFFEIEQGKIGVLIFTHEHSDHFCAEDVREACKKNKELKVWAGERVISILKEAGVPSEQLLQVAVSEEYILGSAPEDIRIRFLNTLHDGDQYAHIQNLTILINIGRQSIVVTGDAMPREELFREIGEWKREIDWLFAPFPYVGLRTARKAICNQLKVEHIFVLHQPRTDAQKWVANTKNICKQAQDGLSYPVFPEGTNKWYEI